MGCNVVWTDSARSDIEEIASYLGDTLLSQQALRDFLGGVRGVADNIAQMSEMYPVSRHRSLVARGIRAARIGRYILLYRQEDDEAIALHVFHQSQDYARLV